jgi:hypothetical protein
MSMNPFMFMQKETSLKVGQSFLLGMVKLQKLRLQR